MNSGVSGLPSQSSAMAAISDNITNDVGEYLALLVLATLVLLLVVKPIVAGDRR